MTIEAFSRGVKYPGFFAMGVAKNESFNRAVLGRYTGDELVWCHGIGEVARVVG
ncbi:hypothetical protein BLSMQ_2059 [Brevibacterium aurantiacum]|uniref:Uncharacterized protein n=1 Tax=Brevibacterium aurantiacum TaxID=273384 RepID=A0A1D7W472_BREAU|nr:hypothetical protein BLSMQ_2059 [Brevibacterium aurantiacum]